ncbi:CPBP family intramembrane metalloprotease [Mucilaginibacter terrenus]|uniref:CPBP family intramembrane metalloprotease n=1 Tax=Mucilaginibacter terrenus TaxID=2482727 RepID=A0A3E2NPH0_9SPHI|nr:CPBP family intramembrane glutamic endopeptidase [Mucilaginibacter terrenus]RFZ82882.1 CPBP family intramembrane metalloprotease [Mucilaginibacter terrenus]
MVKSADNQQSPALQFLIFTLMSIGIVLLFNFIALGIVAAIYGMAPVMQISRMDFSDPDSTRALYLLQIISTTVPLFIAPLIFARFSAKDTTTYLKPTVQFPWLLMIIVFVVMLISAPLVEALSNINQQMVLPKFLKGIEDWMRSSEQQAQKLTKAILRMDSIGDMLKNLFLVGLLTAIAEEFMFRGVLQTIMLRWTGNTHAAIWITAALFSAFHMEFFGFLPRMLLGGLFGYFVAYSGSIWPAVWAHFINNGTAVIVTYLFQHKKIKLNPDDSHTFNAPGYLFSLIIVILLLLVYKNVAQGKKPALN